MIKTVTANRIKNIEGFEYLPQYNFSDDGNRFTMWMYKGIPFSQHRDSEYGTFISLRYDYLYVFQKKTPKENLQTKKLD